MRLVRLALLLSGQVLLSGCAATERVVATAEPFCEAVKPVCHSRDDRLTEGTASQIEANNLGWPKVCKSSVKAYCDGMRTRPAPVPKTEPKTS